MTARRRNEVPVSERTLLSFKDYADLCGVDPWEVTKWAREPGFPLVVPFGAALPKVHRVAADAWILSNPENAARVQAWRERAA